MTPIVLTHVYKEYNLGGPLEIRRLAGRLSDLMSGRHAHPVERRYALRDLSLEVGSGETLGVIGHNGAGKTTLLRLLAGVTLPTSGVVRITGRVAPGKRPHFRALFDEITPAIMQGLIEETSRWAKPGKVEKNVRTIAAAVGASKRVESWLPT